MKFTFNLISILLLGLVNTTFAHHYYCGSVNIFFTGLPHDHPNVTAAGYDPKVVLRSLKTDAARIIAAGYNLRVAFLGPEKGVKYLEEFYRGVQWTGAVVGFGIRGSPDPIETGWFTDILNNFRLRIPRAQLAFNYSPNSTLWALQRQFPLQPGCPPGVDFGYYEVCDANVCPDAGNTTVV